MDLHMILLKSLKYITLFFVLFATIMDIINTMCGQTNTYFKGKFDNINEQNLILRTFGKYGPNYFGLGWTFYVFFYVILNIMTPNRIVPNILVILINLNIAATHTLASCFWMYGGSTCPKISLIIQDALFFNQIIVFFIYVIDRFNYVYKKLLFDTLYSGFLVFFTTSLVYQFLKIIQ